MENTTTAILSILEKSINPQADQKIIQDLEQMFKTRAISETNFRFIRAIMEIQHLQQSGEMINRFKKLFDQHDPIQHELDILTVTLDQWYEKFSQQYSTQKSNLETLAKL